MIRFVHKWRLRRAIRNFSRKFVRGQYPCTCGHWRIVHREDSERPCMIGYHYAGQNFPCPCIKYVPTQESADDFARVIRLARVARSL